jgi:hypothetical protein
MNATSLPKDPVHGALDTMRAMAEADPVDQLWVMALMKLAQLVVEVEPTFRDDQMGVLIAIGALIMPLATAETQANMTAQQLLQNVWEAPRG